MPRNHKQMLAGFYLELLSIPATHIFRIQHQRLYAEIKEILAVELDSDPETIQNIFERMSAEYNA